MRVAMYYSNKRNNTPPVFAKLLLFVIARSGSDEAISWRGREIATHLSDARNDK